MPQFSGLIYDIDKKLQTVIDNYSVYWLSSANHSRGLYTVDPDYRDVADAGNLKSAFGVRVLVSLDSNVLLSASRAGTTTLSGGNLDGDSQEFNYWNIK